MPCSRTTLKNALLFLLVPLCTLVALYYLIFRNLPLQFTATYVLIWTAILYVYIERVVSPVLIENEKKAFTAGMGLEPKKS